ncbi:hypothetical protein MGG_17567 [Pyricularia oryzae 70-15]|uniref:Uncharacterized protein n=1 Tax=Pyricularia oryzae (strain 70-15 / ATCC MYA-4617 / FGSC 8958) TaxID=242507 RepID=G4NFL0_PYRO7|nr:uncharacterized protein MGG_17567 [Pyricularia oryzae 70-15]EHA46817.1 hypothetical protein MGG_17567 [Pyricularia oryzae 70-15]
MQFQKIILIFSAVAGAVFAAEKRPCNQLPGCTPIRGGGCFCPSESGRDPSDPGDPGQGGGPQ